MILSLALRFQKHIALFLIGILFVQLTIAERITFFGTGAGFHSYRRFDSSQRQYELVNAVADKRPLTVMNNKKVTEKSRVLKNSPSTGGGRGEAVGSAFIGGPTQPES